MDRTTSSAIDAAVWTDAARSTKGRNAVAARNSSGRRQLIDPTTCERDYSPAEMEFMWAMQKYKQNSGRTFPTWSDVLEVLHGLGYQKSAG